MTNKQLSLEAQAVLDATNAAYDDAATVREGTAAAIRALADQMPTTFPMSISDLPEDDCRWYKLSYARCGNTNRRWLNSIANELEGK